MSRKFHVIRQQISKEKLRKRPVKIILSVLKATSCFVCGPQIGYQNRARVLKNFRSRHRPYLTFSRSLPLYRLQLYFLFFLVGFQIIAFFFQISGLFPVILAILWKPGLRRGEQEKLPKLPKGEKCGPDEKFLPVIYTKILRAGNYLNNYVVFSLNA